MGAKVSAEMLKARELILKGVNPAEAARRCGLTRSAIYHSTWYKKWRRKQTACYLQSKQFETYQIDEYLSRNSDFAKANLCDHLATLYSESLNCYPEGSTFPQDDLGDLRFVTIMEKIAPLSGKPDYDRLRRDVALILMAKYFETCDIFEEPPHAAT